MVCSRFAEECLGRHYTIKMQAHLKQSQFCKVTIKTFAAAAFPLCLIQGISLCNTQSSILAVCKKGEVLACKVVVHLAHRTNIVLTTNQVNQQFSGILGCLTV